MKRHLLIVASLLALAGCGNTDLTARGAVTATFEGAETGFRFDTDTRLDSPERDETLGLVTGSCEMAEVVDTETGESTWGIVVELRRGGVVDDNGLASVTIMQRSDAEPEAGRIEAELGTTGFASGAANCAVTVPYAGANSGQVGLIADCDVYDADGNVATIAAELDIVGCDIVE